MKKHVRFLLPLLSAPLFLSAHTALAVDFSGYFRAGTGGTSEGGDQVCFQVPGAGAKYRLGNECEVFAELAFSEVVFESDEGAYFRLDTMMAFVVEGEADFENDDPAFRQAWVEAGNVVGGFFEGAKFWAGKRFYRRHDVHINDFYFWGQGGRIGAGVEDVDLGFGKLAYGYFRNANDDFDEFTSAVVDPDTGLPIPGEVRNIQGQRIQINNRAVSSHDIRFYEIEVNPDGLLTLGFDFRISEEDSDEVNGQNGFMFNAIHFQEGLFGGFNKLALQYGQGAASTLQDVSNDEAGSSVITARIVEQLVFQPTRDISGLFVILYEERNDDDQSGSGDPIDYWFSTGIRPKYHFTDYLNVALELGYDRVKPEQGDTRRLYKVTLAPQISAGREFFARPDLRLFVTYANWNGAAEPGVVRSGESPFEDETDGWTFGVQAEAWW